MLPAQVEYWKLQENKRHNERMEALTQQEVEEKTRHNKQDEYVRVGTLNEQQRNNLVVNSQGDRSLGIQQQEADTHLFSAVNNAEIGHLNAQANLSGAAAANTQAAAAMLNAGTNQRVGDSKINLQDTQATQAALNGMYDRQRTAAQTTYYEAQASKTEKEGAYVDFYANLAASKNTREWVNTGISGYDTVARNANTTFRTIMDNVTPWE